ncbi:MAG: phosphoribosylanthranilate isomerase [Nitrososphaerales archaeon]|jgi:phosphoribosylanthranilate isomerase
MVWVKICGITRETDVASAVAAGADAVGFICGFPASPRNISFERAAELAGQVPTFVSPVLITTDEIVQRRGSELRETQINTVQLYGDAVDPDRLRNTLGVRLIRPYIVKSDYVGSAKVEATGFDALLTDTYVPGVQGGSGSASDWGVCRRIKDAILPVPMILSGGLSPENVAEAIATVKPFGVDVSSGVERAAGVKDAGRVAEFIRRAKEADLR